MYPDADSENRDRSGLQHAPSNDTLGDGGLLAAIVSDKEFLGWSGAKNDADGSEAVATPKPIQMDLHGMNSGDTLGDEYGP